MSDEVKALVDAPLERVRHPLCRRPPIVIVARRVKCYVVDSAGQAPVESARHARGGESRVEPEQGEHKPDVPAPSVWPIGFASASPCVLVGLVVSWWIVAIGGAIALVFGFLWVRDARRAAQAGEPSRRPRRARRAAPPPRAAADGPPSDPRNDVPRRRDARPRRGDRRRSSRSRRSSSRSCRRS